MPSQFIWYELLTTDPDAAGRFYSDVVGWTVKPSDQPGMDYRQWTIGGASVGGLMAIPPAAAEMGMRPAWLGYLAVADVDASVARIQAAGGGVRMPGTDIPGVGRFALVTDPQGAAIYVMSPIGEGPSVSHAPMQHGHGGWHELHTTDWQAALAFYSAEFGWAGSRAMDMGPMGTYQTFNAGGGEIGGMMTSPNVPRPAWLYYFVVPSITPAIARLQAGGGTVLHGPMEVPGGAWIVQGQDPQGAMFALVAASKD